MNEHRHQPKNDGSAFVWGGTVFVACAIVGFCVFVALNNKKPDPAPVPVVQQQAAPVQPVPPPVAQPLPPPPPRVVAAPPPAPAVPPPVTAAPPKLQLDRLAGTLRLEVPFTQAGDRMPLQYSCFRNNMSPAMNWHGAPGATQSYVVFLEKRGEPDKEPFVNWILFNIPARVTSLEENQPRSPEFANGVKHANSDHGNIGYIGPCESHGRVPYAMRVFALDTLLNLQPGISKYDLIREMNGHIIDAADKDFTHYYRD